MANKTPSTAGGKLLANEIFSFMKDNIDAMKTNSASKGADENEKQGTQDIANAIAFAIEKVFGGGVAASPGSPAVQLFYLVPPSPTPVPVTGTVDISTINPKYVFK